MLKRSITHITLPYYSPYILTTIEAAIMKRRWKQQQYDSARSLQIITQRRKALCIL